MRAVVMLALAAGCGFQTSAATGDDTPPIDAAVISNADAAPDVFVPLPACMTSSAYTNGPEVGHRYRRIEGKDRDGSVDACNADGAHLAVVTSAAEDAYVRTIAAGANTFIGLDDLTVEDSFRWVNGEPYSYQHFAGLEPNDFGVEDCVVINGGDGTWNDTGCGTAQPAICECEVGYTPRPTPACRAMATNTPHDGRKYFVHEGSGSAKTWADAKADCEIIGAHLAVFADDEEDDSVDREFSGDNWIGLSDLATEGTFKWVDGNGLTFTHWTGGAPHSASPTRNCVRINATWEDQDCSLLKEYACECEP